MMVMMILWQIFFLNTPSCHEVLITDAVRGIWPSEGTLYSHWGNDGMDGWMVDGGMTIQSKRAMVISVSVVYFYITSVHPRGNLTSRERSVATFPLLRGWGFIREAMMNSQQTPTPYGPWVSMHLNEPSLPLPHTTQGFLNSLLSSTTSNTTTAVLALLHPHPLPFLRLSLSHFLLWHFSSWSTKTPFISFSWWTHLHFFFSKHLTSYPSLLLLSIKLQSVVSRHSEPPRLSFLVSFPLSWFWTRRWEAASRWWEHQSCQSAPRLVHHSQGELHTMRPASSMTYCCLRHSTSATGLITLKTAHS